MVLINSISANYLGLRRQRGDGRMQGRQRLPADVQHPLDPVPVGGVRGGQLRAQVSSDWSMWSHMTQHNTDL